MNSTHLEIILEEEVFYLLPQKAIFRPLNRQLLLADIHLGKANHFRKNGIPIPAISPFKDIEMIQFLLDRWQPESVLILGDLFHSEYNNEWLLFEELLSQHQHIQFVLIEGNHDILKTSLYGLPNLVKLSYIEEHDFIFTHHPVKNSKKINFCGHIHPGYRIHGIAKQNESLPCFYFHNNNFILPAFGNLTGLKMMMEEDNACFYLVAKDRIIHYKSVL